MSGRDHATLPGSGHALAPSQDDAMIGRRIIDQFIIRAKLSEGGMGGVYLADQPSIQRTAVIKVIHPWLSKDPGIAARFDIEAQAAARLQNPHIVSIYNYGKLRDGTLFIAMEHIKGHTLAATLERHGRIEPHRAITIATQCCEALAEAHRHGVIHRDVKPSNIILAERHQGPGFVKMVDFGVATIDDRQIAPGHTVTGTPCYMSPEQLGAEPVDGRSDLYSLAIVIYEMLVGQPPFLASSAEIYARLHREVPPPAPGMLAPEVHVPPALEACLMRALAKQPHARPLSAERFSDELWAAVMTPVPIESDGYATSPQVGRPRSRRFRRNLVGGVILVGLIGAAGFQWYGKHQTDTARPSSTTDSPSSPAANSEVDPVKIALRSRSLVELEAELERVAVLQGQTSQSMKSAMTEYHDRIRTTPQGRDPTTYQKEVLTELILQWSQNSNLEHSDASIAELEAVFLRMTSPLDVQERRSMLYRAKSREGASPDSIRARLLSWIYAHGLDYQTGDPGAELVLEDDP